MMAFREKINKVSTAWKFSPEKKTLFLLIFLEEILIIDNLCSDLTYQSVISNIFHQFCQDQMIWTDFDFFIQTLWNALTMWTICDSFVSIWGETSETKLILQWNIWKLSALTLSSNSWLSWHFRTKRKLPVLKNYKCCPTKYLQYFFLFNSPLQVTGEKVHWHIISCNIIQFHL